MIVKVYGPPGTGKTETLKEFMMQLLGYMDFGLPTSTVVPPEKLAVISFSNAAVNEFATRVGMKAKGKHGSPTRYFRTVHGICEVLLLEHGIIDKSKTNMFYDRFQQTLQAKFCKFMHVPYSTDPFALAKGNVYMTEITRIINLYYTVMDIDSLCALHPDPKFMKAYITWKKRYKLYDYNDLLTLTFDHREELQAPCKAVIVDECQDLTPLQWHILYSIFQGAEDFIYAGDDLQTIYTFSGAIPDIFLKLKADKELVLQKSYRLRKGVWAFSQALAMTLEKKKVKDYLWFDEGGKVQIRSYRKAINHAVSLARKKKKVFILTRTNKMALRIIKDLVFRRGILPGTIKDPPAFLERIYSLLSVYRGNKNSAVKAVEKEIDAVVNIIKNEGDLRRYIKVDTIHAVKGMEADHVIQVMSVQPTDIIIDDTEKRTLYVGITRTRGDLDLVYLQFAQQWFSRDFIEALIEASKV